MATNEGNGKSEGVFKTIIVAVVIALVAGGSAPWWWGKVFPTPSLTPLPSPSPFVTPTQPKFPTPTPKPDYSIREINNNDPGIRYSGDCGYNHGLSSLLYNDDVDICNKQGDSFTYTFTGKSIYMVTVYQQGEGGVISCYIDNSLTQSYNLNSSKGVDSSGFAYGVVLPIAPALVYGEHTASCKMTSANTKFYIDALIINK